MASSAPVNGTEERLDEVLAELRALRGALVGQSAVAPDPAPGGVIELREPARPTPAAATKRARR